MVSSTGLRPIQTQDLRTEDFRRCKIGNIGKGQTLFVKFYGTFPAERRSLFVYKTSLA